MLDRPVLSVVHDILALMVRRVNAPRGQQDQCKYWREFTEER